MKRESTIKIRIPRPDDSRTSDEIEVSTRNYINTDTIWNVQFSRESSEPLVNGLKESIKNAFFSSRRSRYSSIRRSRTIKDREDGVLLNLYGCPILLTHKSRVSINGTKHSRDNAISILARMFVKAIRERDGAKLMLHLNQLNKLPANVSYALENRAPFNFWHEYQKHEVRLNVQLIGDKEVAIELSDGVWGTMTVSELDSFCNAHRYNSKRSKWAYISPKQLYIETVGKEPLSSEIKVMKSFLLQNRTQELVDSRARELIYGLVEKYPNRISIVESHGYVSEMYVRGILYDWKLTSSYKGARKTGKQDVSTFVFSSNDEDTFYRGPICIDNLGTNSSVGDQYVARALALLNDHIVVKMVSTIETYLPKDAPTVRDSENNLSPIRDDDNVYLR